MLEVYGVPGIAHHTQGYVLVNNHPLRTLKVYGRVLSFSLHCRPRADFYLVTIDDCSADCLSIVVKVPVLKVKTGIKENVYVQVVGIVSFVHHLDRQLSADRFTVMGNAADLSLEIACLKEILAVRDMLACQWRYTPCVESGSRSAAPPPPLFSQRRRRLHAEKARLFRLDNNPRTETIAYAQDSINKSSGDLDDDTVYYTAGSDLGEGLNSDGGMAGAEVIVID